MKTKSFIISALLLGFMLCLTMVPDLTAIEKQEEKKPAEVVIIPQEVKAVLQEGMAARQARMDIPFTFSKHIYLPAQQNLHNIFLIKVKNADLGFAPAPAEPAAQVESENPPQETPAQLQARNHVFLQFNQLDGTFVKEVYVPFNLEEDQATFDPEKEIVYSTGYPLPSGKFLLSMAIASVNLEKIGTQYLEFDLPGPASFIDELGITPVFFAKNMTRMESPEIRTEIHKEYFTYSILQIVPNLEHVFSVGENLDIFFFIFGAQPNEEGRNDITVNYEIVKGEEKIIRFSPTNYDMPLVSQPLPMKRTVMITTTKGDETSERKEAQDISPGEYSLTFEITCNISGKTLKQSVDFTVE